jgi:hypothetical protein
MTTATTFLVAVSSASYRSLFAAIGLALDPARWLAYRVVHDSVAQDRMARLPLKVSAALVRMVLRICRATANLVAVVGDRTALREATDPVVTASDGEGGTGPCAGQMTTAHAIDRPIAPSNPSKRIQLALVSTRLRVNRPPSRHGAGFAFF